MQTMEKELYSLLYQYTHPDGNRCVTSVVYYLDTTKIPTGAISKPQKCIKCLIIRVLLKPNFSRYVDWDDPFTDSLWFAIVNKYSVQEWLGLAQKFAAKVYSELENFTEMLPLF